MTQIEFIKRFEDYKQKTDLFPHMIQTPEKQVQIPKKSKKFAKNSKVVAHQKTKE